MPEYKCYNIGVHDYPVWLTLSGKANIVAIEITSYAETVMYRDVIYPMKTTVTVVVDGCCVEVKSPLSVDSVCRILGFVWDETDVTAKPSPTEEAKPEGGPS